MCLSSIINQNSVSQHGRGHMYKLSRQGQPKYIHKGATAVGDGVCIRGMHHQQE